jgi:putative Holliday junction resolvase
MRYLAIDYGNKRTGLAICDHSEKIVSPLTVIQGRKQLLEKIALTIKSENVDAIVLGLPLNMDDSEGPQARAVLRFGQRLEQRFKIPVYFQDERLTTFGAEQKLADRDFTRREKQKHLDAFAAAEILQIFLDKKNA